MSAGLVLPRAATRSPNDYLVHWECPITGAAYAETVAAVIAEELIRTDRDRATVMLASWMARNHAWLRREE